MESVSRAYRLEYMPRHTMQKTVNSLLRNHWLAVTIRSSH